MLRLALLMLVFAFAVVGGRADVAAARVAESEPRPQAAEPCCPCHDEGQNDGCYGLNCPCFQPVAADVTPTPGVLPEPAGISHPSAWALLSEEMARDRRSAPPTRPPIG